MEQRGRKIWLLRLAAPTDEWGPNEFAGRLAATPRRTPDADRPLKWPKAGAACFSRRRRQRPKGASAGISAGLAVKGRRRRQWDTTCRDAGFCFFCGPAPARRRPPLAPQHHSLARRLPLRTAAAAPGHGAPELLLTMSHPAARGVLSFCPGHATVPRLSCHRVRLLLVGG